MKQQKNNTWLLLSIIVAIAIALSLPSCRNEVPSGMKKARVHKVIYLASGGFTVIDNMTYIDMVDTSYKCGDIFTSEQYNMYATLACDDSVAIKFPKQYKNGDTIFPDYAIPDTLIVVDANALNVRLLGLNDYSDGGIADVFYRYCSPIKHK